MGGGGVNGGCFLYNHDFGDVWAPYKTCCSLASTDLTRTLSLLAFTG